MHSILEKLKDIKIVCLTWVIVSYIFPSLNAYDLKLLRTYVKKGAVAFDIGANIGCFTFTMSRLAGREGAVIACEPIADNLKKLMYAKHGLGLDNVTIEPVAVSNSKGTCHMAIPLLKGIPKKTRSYIDINSQGGIEQTTVQHLFEKHKLSKIDFIKCDVEGAEKLVFQGAAKLIKEHRPIVLCEIQDHHSKRFGTSANETMWLIRDLGRYEVYGIFGNKIRPVKEVCDTCINYLFLPKNHHE